jgi:hypothetical protein
MPGMSTRTGQVTESGLSCASVVRPRLPRWLNRPPEGNVCQAERPAQSDHDANCGRQLNHTAKPQRSRRRMTTDERIRTARTLL